MGSIGRVLKARPVLKPTKSYDPDFRLNAQKSGYYCVSGLIKRAVALSRLLAIKRYRLMSMLG